MLRLVKILKKVFEGGPNFAKTQTLSPPKFGPKTNKLVYNVEKECTNVHFEQEGTEASEKFMKKWDSYK